MGIAEQDKDHDVRFETYLCSKGWRSQHESVMFTHGNNSDGQVNADTSADASGSFHGDNPRFNLFPDSSEGIDLLVGEPDRFSELSFSMDTNTRNYNTQRDLGYNTGEHSYSVGNTDSDEDMVVAENREYNGENEDDNGRGNTNLYQHQQRVSGDDDDDVDDDNELQLIIEEEFKTSLFDYFGDLNLCSNPLRSNNFIYTKKPGDNHKPVPKSDIYSFTKISNSENDSGIPLNARDAIENYNRTKSTEINYMNIDRVLESKDPMFAMSNQPKEKFSQSAVLDVNAVSQQRLKIPNLGRLGSTGYFRGNLSKTYFCNGYQVLIVATGSRINIFDMSYNRHKSYDDDSDNKDWPFIGWIDLKSEVTTLDRLIHSVHPSEPFVINYLTIGKLFNDEDVLAVCNDYSQLIILSMKQVLDELFAIHDDSNEKLFTRYLGSNNLSVFQAHSRKNGISFFESKHQFCPTKLFVSSSAWCVDIWNDRIAVSDNSQTITLFRLSGGLSYDVIKSPILGHNIPFVNILKSSSSERNNDLFICCGTYSKHIYILQIPENEKNMKVIDSVGTSGPVWSCNFVCDDDFLTVNSISELTGDVVSDLDGDKINDIISQSAMLGAVSDPLYSSHLGLAGYFAHSHVPSITSRHYNKNDRNKRMAVNEIYQLNRIRKVFDLWYLKNKRGDKLEMEKYDECGLKFSNTNKDKIFILPTTDCSIGLFSFTEMINTSTCNCVFPIIETPFMVERNIENIDIDNGNEFISFRGGSSNILPGGFEFLNRINLSFVIPELNAVVVGTQAGQVAIFRLTKYCGLHSMRLEWVLMDAERYAMDRDGNVRSIIGLSGYHNGYDNNGEAEWVIVVVYSDLLSLSYRVNKSQFGIDDIFNGL